MNIIYQNSWILDGFRLTLELAADKVNELYSKF